MDSVFVIQHVHVFDDGNEDVKMIGVYRTLASARMAVIRLKGEPGFCDQSDVIVEGVGDEPGFHINEYHLDKDHWTDGFVTV